MNARTLEAEHVTVQGLEIRYSVFPGNSERPPLLICNGIGQSLETLETLATSFPKRDVILYDAPGAGRSQVPRVPATIRRHSRVAVGLLDELGYGEVDVLGISWGGSTAQQIARSFPDRCRRLILSITAAGGIAQIPGPPGVMLEMLFPTRYISERRRNKMVPKLYGGEALRDPSVILGQYGRNRAPSLYGYCSQLVVSRIWTSVHWLHRLTQPTLVLSGEQDPLVPPLNQKLLARLIPNSEFRSYDCGHLLMTTRRKEVVADIEEFLDS